MILEGIVIGGAGGALAGLTVWWVDWLHKAILRRKHQERVFTWLDENTSDRDGKKFRTTRAIASHNDLTEDRVRFVCSHDPRIVLSTGDDEDVWGIKELVRPA